MKMPKISVCVPTYNGARYLDQALDSVLCQTLPDFELIVYDDASSDETPQLVARRSDQRLRYFRQPCNVGIADNRNSCLRVARGQYIAWLDSDDIYHPEMLARQSSVLDEHPNVGLVHGAYEVIGPDGSRLKDWPLPFSEDVIQCGHAAFRELILSNYITAPTVMVRRDCYDRVGPYMSGLGNSSEDWEMWLRIALHTNLAYTATTVARYRQHDASTSTVTTRSGERFRKDIMVVDRIFARQWPLIADAIVLQRRARAALAAKALIYAGDLFTLGRRLAALMITLRGLQIARLLLPSRECFLLLLSIVRDEEYWHYRYSKALLGQLSAQMVGSRYGARIQRIAVVDSEWNIVLHRIARTISRLVPKDAHVICVDKYDPTLLHVSQRKGWHFPDRRLLPGGYPKDSRTAVEHLEQLKMRGASYILFPSAAFWWLEYYGNFAKHLDGCYERIWRDEDCMIYHLSTRRAERVAA